MNTPKILRCPHCGNVIEWVDNRGPIPVCCGEPMKEMTAKTADHSTEKHVPIPVEHSGGGSRIAVGSTPHPMTNEHYIEWIEIVNGSWVNRYYLKPGDKPEAFFHVELKPGMVVREYCNVHGLWENTIK